MYRLIVTLNSVNIWLFVVILVARYLFLGSHIYLLYRVAQDIVKFNGPFCIFCKNMYLAEFLNFSIFCIDLIATT